MAKATRMTSGPIGKNMLGSDAAAVRMRVEAMEKLLERTLVIPGTRQTIGLGRLLGIRRLGERTAMHLAPGVRDDQLRTRARDRDARRHAVMGVDQEPAHAVLELRAYTAEVLTEEPPRFARRRHRVV